MTTQHLGIPDDLEEHLGRLGSEIDRRAAALDDEDTSSGKRVKNVARGASALIQREQDNAATRAEERTQLEAIKARAERMLETVKTDDDSDGEEDGDTPDSDDPTDGVNGDDSDEGDTSDDEPTTPQPDPAPVPTNSRRFGVANNWLGAILALMAGLIVLAWVWPWVTTDFVVDEFVSYLTVAVKVIVSIAAVAIAAFVAGYIGDRLYDAYRDNVTQRQARA